MKFNRLLIVFSILALAALACNLGAGGASTPTAPGDSISTGDNGDASSNDTGNSGDSTNPGDTGDSSNPGDSSGSNGEPMEAPATIDLDDPTLYDQPDTVSAYKTTLDYLFDAPGPVTGTVLMDSATQVEPYATTLEFYTYGDAVMGNEEVFTFTQILDTQYIVYTDFGCQSGLPGLQANPFDVALDTGGTLTGMADLIGPETVNEVPVYAYNLTMDNIDPLDPAGKDFESLSNGKLYLAQSTLSVVKVILDGTGVSEVLSQDPALVGDIYYELNYFDFDVPVEIEVPVGCVGGAGSDTETVYPMPDDASDIIQFGGEILTFSTALSPEEVVVFYEAEMPTLGCSAPEVVEDAVSGITMMFNGCDFGGANILVVQDGGGSLVSIFGIPQE